MLSSKLSRVLLPAAMLSLAGCATKPAQPLSRFEFEQPQMGVSFRMVIYAPSEASAQSAAEAAYGRIKQLNAILSDYESDSELSRLSQTAGTGRQIKVSPELWQVLERAQQIATQSDGAFDITAGPYISLWRRARRIYRLPEPEKMAAAKEAVGFAKLRLNARNRTAELLAPRMRLDLGGIAKGYAVDQALATLKQHGIRSALVAGSGDMAVSEPPPGKPGWQIEIAAHDGTNAPAKKYAMLRNYALATSGDVFQSLLIEGKRYSHIVNPRTGLGLTDHSLVTIIAPNCMTADALATAVSVLEPKQGIALIEQMSGAAALITRQPDGAVEQSKSSRFQRFLTSGQ